MGLQKYDKLIVYIIKLLMYFSCNRIINCDRTNVKKIYKLVFTFFISTYLKTSVRYNFLVNYLIKQPFNFN